MRVVLPPLFMPFFGTYVNMQKPRTRHSFGPSLHMVAHDGHERPDPWQGG